MPESQHPFYRKPPRDCFYYLIHATILTTKDSTCYNHKEKEKSKKVLEDASVPCIHRKNRCTYRNMYIDHSTNPQPKKQNSQPD